MPEDCTVVTIPQLGVNDDTAILIEWHVPDEAAVGVGDRLCTLETTKAVFDVQADTSGYVIHLIEARDEMKIAAPIALIGSDLERLRVRRDRYRNETAAIAHDLDRDAGPVQATDKAKVLARALGVDLTRITGTGIIRERDVARFHRQEAPAVQTSPGELTWDAARTPVVVYGAGRGAVTVSECTELQGTHTVVCFVDDRPEHAAEPGRAGSATGLPVFHGTALTDIVARGVRTLALAVANAEVRLRICRKCKELNIEPMNVVHPRAWISPSARIGSGNYVKAGALIDTKTRIGDGCIIDNNVTIPHDNVIGDGCHLAPGVAMGSGIVLGDRCIVGIGASVSTNLRIGQGVIVSVGSAVTKDVPALAVVEGVPARVVGTRTRAST